MILIEFLSVSDFGRPEYEFLKNKEKRFIFSIVYIFEIIQ